MADKTNRELFAEAAAEAEKTAGIAEGAEEVETKPADSEQEEKKPETLDTDSNDGADHDDDKKTNPESDQPDATKPTDDKKDKPAEEVETDDKKSDDGVDAKDEMPVEMARKYSDKWKAADPEFKAELKRIFDNNQQTIARFKSKTKDLESAISIANAEIFNDVKQFGITREQSIKNRLNLVSQFQRNPDATIIGVLAEKSVALNNPAGLIRAIAEMHKIDLETLTKVDPKVAVLEDKIAANEAYKRAEKAAKQAQDAANNAVAENEVLEAAQVFMQRHPEVQVTDVFKQQMDLAAVRIAHENPGISSIDLFEKAYEAVQALTVPQQPKPETVKKTVVKEIPKKPVVSLKNSDDTTGKVAIQKIDVNDPQASRKLFASISKATGLSQ